VEVLPPRQYVSTKLRYLLCVRTLASSDLAYASWPMYELRIEHCTF